MSASLCIVAIVLSVAQSGSGAAANVPSAQTLLDESLALVKANPRLLELGVRGSPLLAIAEAQATVGNVAEARTTALSIKDKVMQTVTLEAIARVQVLRGDIAGALATISLAPAEDRYIIATGIAREQISHANLQAALETFEKTPAEQGSDGSFERMCRLDVLEIAGMSDKLPKEARRKALDELTKGAALPGDLKGMFRWTQIASIAAAVGDTDRAKSAIAAARKLVRENEKPTTLGVRQQLALAVAESDAGMSAEAAKSFLQATEMAKKIEDQPWYRASVLTEIGQAQLKAGKKAEADSAFQAALELAKGAPDRIQYSVFEVVQARCSAKDWQGARSTCDKLTSNDDHAEAVSDVAVAQADAGDAKLCIETVQAAAKLVAQSQSAAKRVKLYAVLAESAHSAGDAPLADQLLRSALESAKLVDGDSLKAASLSVVARAQVKTGHHSAAWQTIGQIGDPEFKSISLAELALAAARNAAKTQK